MDFVRKLLLPVGANVTRYGTGILLLPTVVSTRFHHQTNRDSRSTTTSASQENRNSVGSVIKKLSCSVPEPISDLPSTARVNRSLLPFPTSTATIALEAVLLACPTVLNRIRRRGHGIPCNRCKFPTSFVFDHVLASRQGPSGRKGSNSLTLDVAVGGAFSTCPRVNCRRFPGINARRQITEFTCRQGLVCSKIRQPRRDCVTRLPLGSSSIPDELQS